MDRLRRREDTGYLTAAAGSDAATDEAASCLSCTSCTENQTVEIKLGSLRGSDTVSLRTFTPVFESQASAAAAAAEPGEKFESAAGGPAAAPAGSITSTLSPHVKP